MNKILLVLFAVAMVTLAVVAEDTDEGSEPTEQEVQEEVDNEEADVVSSVDSAVQTLNEVFARDGGETPQQKRINWGHAAAGAGLVLLGKKRSEPEERDLAKRGWGHAVAAAALLGKRGEEERDLAKRGWGHAVAAAALLGKRGEEERDLAKRGWGHAVAAAALLGKRGEEESEQDTAAVSDQDEFQKDVVKVQQALDVLETLTDVAEQTE